MKKYIALLIVTVMILTAASLIPTWVTGSLVDVTLTTLKPYGYTETVTANGTVEYAQKKEVYVDLPVIPEAVYVEIGQKVKVGDVLAKVDKEETCSAAMSLLHISGDSIPSELITAFSNQALGAEDLLELIPDSIVSNANGVITDLSLVKGAVIMPNTVAATISNSNKLQAKVSVSESAVAKVKAGQVATISGNGFKGKKYTGKVTKVYPTARKQYVGTTQQTVVDVLLTFDKIDNQVKSGFTVRADIQTSAEKQFPALPYDCIGQDEKGEFVYLYQAGKTFKRYVKTGTELTDAVEIVSGIDADDWIVWNASDVQHNTFVQVAGQK